MMFAIITPALISGAVVGRMKFKAYVLFILGWSIVVYNPIAHWVWLSVVGSITLVLLIGTSYVNFSALLGQ